MNDEDEQTKPLEHLLQKKKLTIEAVSPQEAEKHKVTKHLV